MGDCRSQFMLSDFPRSLAFSEVRLLDSSSSARCPEVLTVETSWILRLFIFCDWFTCLADTIRICDEWAIVLLIVLLLEPLGPAWSTKIGEEISGFVYLFPVPLTFGIKPVLRPAPLA